MEQTETLRRWQRDRQERLGPLLIIVDTLEWVLCVQPSRISTNGAFLR